MRLFFRVSGITRAMLERYAFDYIVWNGVDETRGSLSLTLSM